MNVEKINVAIIGPGNIGSDLMYKIRRSKNLNLVLMTGIVESEGIKRAEKFGIRTSTKGVDAILEDDSIKIIFEATSAAVHIKNAPIIKKAGCVAIDLTPAALGPYLIPAVNADEVDIEYEKELNMVTCGGQATVPIIAAINRVVPVEYGEIIASLSSKAAGPGTRANIDEFTETTSKAIVKVGGAKAGKAIIVLNPAVPPVMMQNTIYAEVNYLDDERKQKITESVMEMVKTLQQYVPGYQLKVPPIFDDSRVTVIVRVEGAGDFLPTYAGNLDIINCAAIATAEKIAEKMMNKGGVKR